MTVTQKVRTFRVAEIFGPTIQGEGRNVGMPCHFVRFGGCDFRCEWCDTPHAVLPEMVNKLPKMDYLAIYNAIRNLPSPDIQWIVFTGGNPGLLNLEEPIRHLHRHGYRIMVETQGTTYRPWYNEVDEMCFSPKPPSSGNVTDLDFLARILAKMEEAKSEEIGEWVRASWIEEQAYMKVPVFSDADLDYAEKVHAKFPHFELFLSIGNMDPSLPTVGNPNPDVPPRTDLTRDWVLDQFANVVEDVLWTRPSLQDCRIFPQQHTLLWGNARGH